jgi:ABC-type lipoprotein export system ATPase subunit
MMNILEMYNIYKRVGGEIVLRELNLVLREGVIIAVRGRSGVGKTTLAKIASLISKPDDGIIRFMGVDTRGLRDDELSSLRLKYIGYIDQECILLEKLTAWENAEISLKLLGVEKILREKILSELFELLGLKGLEMRRPDELSGGQRQRIVLVRALSKRPKMLIADEPFAHLDDETIKIVMRVIRDMTRDIGMSTIITTTELHTDLDVDEDYILENGFLRRRS